LNPDLNSQTIVVALATLSIWINLKIKMLASQIKKALQLQIKKMDNLHFNN